MCQREVLLSKKHVAAGEIWSQGVRAKDKLNIGDTVSIQALAGKTKNTWSLSGVVVDVAGPESYWVRLDGSGRLAKRKRMHLKLIYPFLKQMEKVDIKKDKITLMTSRARPRKGKRFNWCQMVSMYIQALAK